jgi:hypothetical protein
VAAIASSRDRSLHPCLILDLRGSAIDEKLDARDVARIPVMNFEWSDVPLGRTIDTWLVRAA